MKNSEPVFNINITLQDKNVSTPYGSGSGSGGARTARITTNNSLDPRNNSGAAAGAFNPADPTVSLNIPNARGAAASASASSSNILTSASDSSNYSILGQSGINTRIAGGSGADGSGADGSGINDAPVYSTDDLYNSIGDGRVVEYTDSDGMQHTQIMPDRIYDPINYKQQYRGDSAYRPNVCSYGTKQIVNPIYLSAEGTDLREAIENTQVGSIMPKFAYREYEDVK
jgi:hypothetical protein